MEKSITVKLSEKRYDALKFVLKGKGTTVEKEVDETINQLFNKHVKGELRAFVESSEGKTAPVDGQD